MVHKQSELPDALKLKGLTSISWFRDKTAHFLCGKLKPTCLGGIAGWALTEKIKCCPPPVLTSICLQNKVLLYILQIIINICVYIYIYFTSGGKSWSFIIAQFVSDNSSVGHFVALKDWNQTRFILI